MGEMAYTAQTKSIRTKGLAQMNRKRVLGTSCALGLISLVPGTARAGAGNDAIDVVAEVALANAATNVSAAQAQAASSSSGAHAAALTASTPGVGAASSKAAAVTATAYATDAVANAQIAASNFATAELAFGAILNGDDSDLQNFTDAYNGNNDAQLSANTATTDAAFANDAADTTADYEDAVGCGGCGTASPDSSGSGCGDCGSCGCGCGCGG
jgi:hypothetical protein